MWLELHTERCLELEEEDTVVMSIAMVRKLSLLRRDLLVAMLVKRTQESSLTGVDIDARRFVS